MSIFDWRIKKDDKKPKKKSKKNIQKQVVSAKDIFGNLKEDLPPPSEIFDKAGVDRNETIKAMTKDPHIKTCLNLLFSGVLKRKTVITSDDDELTKELSKRFLKVFPFYDCVKQLLTCIAWGYAVAEIEWGETKGYWYPVDSTLIPQDLIQFGSDGIPYIGYGTTKKTLDNPYRFLIIKNQGIVPDMYGESVLETVYFYWRMRITGFRLWMIVLERFGIPTLILHYLSDYGDDADEVADAILDEFDNLDEDGVIATNNVEKVTQISSSGTKEDFNGFIEAVDAEISKAIIGTPMLTKAGAEGATKTVEVQTNINYRFTVQSTIQTIKFVVNNQLVQPYCAINNVSGENESDIFLDIKYLDLPEWEKVKDAVSLKVPQSLALIYEHTGKPIDEADTFVSTTPKDADYDWKVGTKDTEAETGKVDDKSNGTE